MKIKDCRSCPFFTPDFNVMYCGHPDLGQWPNGHIIKWGGWKNGQRELPIPHECPLRKGPTTLRHHAESTQVIELDIAAIV